MLAPSGAEDRESLPVNEAFILRGHDGPVLGVRFNQAGTYALSCGKVSHMQAVLLAFHAASAYPFSRFHMAVTALMHSVGPCDQVMEPSQGESHKDVQWYAPPQPRQK